MPIRINWWISLNFSYHYISYGIYSLLFCYQRFWVIPFWLSIYIFTGPLTASSWVSMIVHPMLRPFRPLQLERCVDPQYLFYWVSQYFLQNSVLPVGSPCPNSLHKYKAQSLHLLEIYTRCMRWRLCKAFFMHLTSLKIFSTTTIQVYLYHCNKFHGLTKVQMDARSRINK